MRISKSLPFAMGIGIGALALVSGIAAAEEVAAPAESGHARRPARLRLLLRRMEDPHPAPQPLSGSTRPAPSRRSRLTEAVPGK